MEATGGWVELVRVREPAKLGLFKSLLEASAIEHVIEGEAVQGLFPFAAPGFFHDRGLGAVLRVRAEDLDDARRLIEEQDAGEPEADS